MLTSSELQNRRTHLETLKVAELKAFCKEAKLIGYSKLKRADLIDRLCQTRNPEAIVSRPLIQLSSEIAQHDQGLTHPIHTPGSRSMAQGTLALEVESTTLAAPIETRTLRVLFSCNDAATDPYRAAAISSIPSSSSVIALHPQPSPPGKQAPIDHSLNHPKAVDISAGKQWEHTIDAAVSLKDAVKRQRELKRKANETGVLSTSALQKRKRKAMCSHPSSGNSPKAAAATETESSLPTQFHPDPAGCLFPTHRESPQSALQSAPLDSRAFNTPHSITSAGSSRIDGYTAVSDHAGLTSINSGSQAGKEHLTTTSNHKAPDFGVARKTLLYDDANAKKLPPFHDPRRRPPAGAFQTVRRRNPNTAPLRKSMIPQDDGVLQRFTVTPTTSSSLALNPPGTVPLSTSEYIKINIPKKIHGNKNRIVSKFNAPAPIRGPIVAGNSVPKPIRPSLSTEEPLLFEHKHLPIAIINGDSADRKSFTARIQKSWLYRFYHELAAARSVALMIQGASTADGSRSPIGLPGMSPEFVWSATTTSQEFNVATVFVIARIHTLIQADDWMCLIKKEEVVSVAKIGGGIWEVHTKLQVQDAARILGGSDAFKTRKCIYTIIGITGEVIAKSDKGARPLRADWKSYIALVPHNATVSLFDYWKTKDDTSYPRGIAAGWSAQTKNNPKFQEEYDMAERYVLSNVMPNSCSGDYRSSLQMDAAWTGQGTPTLQPRHPKVNLYLPESHQVESVSFIARGAVEDRPLHPSVAIVKRKTAEDFVLRETGQVIGNCEEARVAVVWQNLLGCDATGVALSRTKAKGLTEQFWTSWTNDMLDL